MLAGYAGPAADTWTWVLVRNERGGLRVRAAGVLDVWILPDDPTLRALFAANEGAYEDLWQHVHVTCLPPGGAAVLIEEECGVRGVC